MKAKTRSISGAVLMLVIVPILAGLLACMPVPIGDPERSRIDPALSGWWVLEDGGSNATLCLLRPYDKRTWLVFLVSVEAGDGAGVELPDISTTGDLLAVLQQHDVGAQGIVGGEPAVYKTWMTNLSGKRFMTWEAVASIDDVETFAPEYWFVFKVGAQSDSYFELTMLDSDYDAFEALAEEFEEGVTDPWKVRKQWERVIRKHVDDPELYADSAMQLRRLPDELVPKAARLVESSFDY
jgi:hypothetical protein